MIRIRLRRMAAGSYIYSHPRVGITEHYRIERGWADAPKTDRRRETWVLSFVYYDAHADVCADILSDHPTLSSARTAIEARL